MSTRSRREYFAILIERYRKIPSKKQRSELINEAVANTGQHRKSILRTLNSDTSSRPPTAKLGRPRGYSNQSSDLLKRLWKESDYSCSEKLKRMLPVLLGQLREPVDLEFKKELMRMSPSTMDRYLRAHRGLERRRVNAGTRQGLRIFRNQVPLKSLGNVAPRPGYLQADTVSHCGGTTSGEHYWSLTATDEKSGWTENRGCQSKSSASVLPAIRSVHESLPFDLIQFNVDNGSEFLNARVIEYFRYLAESKVIPFPMSRTRSYRKNDNCHVEQKNWTHVREIFGYDRLEGPELLPLMNEIYRINGLIQNYFVPQFKLKSKVRVGNKIKKTYDTPKTPYERLLEDSDVSDEQKRRLRETYSKLNYFDLKAEREELLARFNSLKKELQSKKTG